MENEIYTFKSLDEEYIQFKNTKGMKQDEIDEKFDFFKENYSISKLNELNEDQLVDRLFGGAVKTPNGLFEWLEKGELPTSCQVGLGETVGVRRDTDTKSLILYKTKNGQETIDEKTGNLYAKKILKALNETCNIIEKYIKNGKFQSSKQDYIEACCEICDILTKEFPQKLTKWYWGKKGEPYGPLIKYYFCSFPKFFVPIYSTDSLRRVLNKLPIEDEIDKLAFVQNGQISLYSRSIEADSLNFDKFINDKGFYSKTEGRVWKIRHNTDDFPNEGLELLKNRKVITMNSKAPRSNGSNKTQAQIFSEDIAVGDLFYLCHDDQIQLIGEIVSSECVSNTTENSTWLEYNYEPRCDLSLVKKYDGKQDKGREPTWSPKSKSLVAKIEDEALIDFEKLILDPCFNTNLSKLFNETDCSNDKGNNEAQEMSHSPISKNTILYGPPGTGKTYHTAIYAVAICDNKNVEQLKLRAKDPAEYEEIYKRYNVLINEGRVKFTTFHQSYGYEDFIEGIKPNIVKGNIEYRVEDGVFKKFCGLSLDAAWDSLIKEAQNNKNIINVKWIVDNTDRSLECKKKQNDDNYAFYDSFNEDVNSRYHNATKEGIAQWLDNIDKGLGENSNFPPNRRHLNLCKSVYQKLRKDFNLNNPNLNKVFIIDEINRGNISKIFGELITLIEDDKRDVTHVTLPLSPTERFTVPKNVYILGTMNTADRSIALMDTALRRRFNFVEMMPEPKVFEKKDADGNYIDVEIAGVNIKSLLEKINERIEYLYDREHTIGHAYFKEFIGGKGDIGGLRATFKNKIIPLLQEYFYDDYEKIALVLADENAKTKFIKVKNAPAEWLGKQYDEGEKYDIDPEIWNIKDEDFAVRLIEIYDKNNKQTEEEIE